MLVLQRNAVIDEVMVHDTSMRGFPPGQAPQQQLYSFFGLCFLSFGFTVGRWAKVCMGLPPAA